jgi:hypothetical protein
MGEQPKLPGMQHDRGYGYERTQHNALEKAFADAWEQENQPRPGINHGGGILQDLFYNRAGRPIHEVTDSERMVAATVVQWLGTNVGFSFLTEILRKQGFRIIPEVQMPPDLSGFAADVADALVEFHLKARKVDLAADLGIGNMMPTEELILKLAGCLGAKKQRTLATVRELLEDPPQDRGDFYHGILCLVEKELEERANPTLAIKERLLDELRKKPRETQDLSPDVFDDPDDEPDPRPLIDPVEPPF